LFRIVLSLGVLHPFGRVIDKGGSESLTTVRQKRTDEWMSSCEGGENFRDSRNCANLISGQNFVSSSLEARFAQVFCSHSGTIHEHDRIGKARS